MKPHAERATCKRGHEEALEAMKKHEDVARDWFNKASGIVPQDLPTLTALLASVEAEARMDALYPIYELLRVPGSRAEAFQLVHETLAKLS